MNRMEMCGNTSCVVQIIILCFRNTGVGGGGGGGGDGDGDGGPPPGRKNWKSPNNTGAIGF